MAKKSAAKPSGRASVPASRLKSSTLLDTRVIYCGDNLEQLSKLPDACVSRPEILKGLPSFSPALTRQRLRWVWSRKFINSERVESLRRAWIKPFQGFDFRLTISRRSSFLATPG
jgi:hypothetical protein